MEKPIKMDDLGVPNFRKPPFIESIGPALNAKVHRRWSLIEKRVDGDHQRPAFFSGRVRVKKSLVGISRVPPM